MKMNSNRYYPESFSCDKILIDVCVLSWIFSFWISFQIKFLGSILLWIHLVKTSQATIGADVVKENKLDHISENIEWKGEYLNLWTEERNQIWLTCVLEIQIISHVNFPTSCIYFLMFSLSNVKHLFTKWFCLIYSEYQILFVFMISRWWSLF